MSFSSPMPVPSAVISVVSSCDASIRSKRTFSTLRILPLSGRIAWNARLRPCLAEPPADSPSTMNSSLFAGSRSWQSASLPGSDDSSSAPLRCTISRALRAASRARDASSAFVMIVARVLGVAARGTAPSFSLTTAETAVATSDETSLSLAWFEYFGSPTLTEMTAVRPSRRSSPDRPPLASLSSLFSFA